MHVRARFFSCDAFLPLCQERAVGAATETNGDKLRESSYVMSQVAFLCQSINPDLANKATTAAIQVLLKVVTGNCVF
jgi:hypothetical protein